MDSVPNFSNALNWLKSGKRVARQGWNGKGMFVYLVSGSTIHPTSLRNEAAAHIIPKINPDNNEWKSDAEVSIGPRLDFVADDGVIECGWRPTSRDMLAEDWMEV